MTLKQGLSSQVCHISFCIFYSLFFLQYFTGALCKPQFCSHWGQFSASVHTQNLLAWHMGPDVFFFSSLPWDWRLCWATFFLFLASHRPESNHYCTTLSVRGGCREGGVGFCSWPAELLSTVPLAGYPQSGATLLTMVRLHNVLLPFYSYFFCAVLPTISSTFVYVYFFLFLLIFLTISSCLLWIFFFICYVLWCEMLLALYMR